MTFHQPQSSYFIVLGLKNQLRGTVLKMVVTCFDISIVLRMLKIRCTFFNVIQARTAQKESGVALRHSVLHWKLQTAGR